MRKIFYLIIIFLVVMNSAGCETVRKKFTRKRKEPLKMPRIYQVKRYEKRPTPELYKKHYAFWASWQSELIKVLGENHKKDSRCIEEIIGNLEDMRKMLVKEKADILARHIEGLAKVRDVILKEELTTYNKDYVRRRLEKTERAIKRDFNFKKVKDSLKKDFDEGDAQEPG